MMVGYFDIAIARPEGQPAVSRVRPTRTARMRAEPLISFDELGRAS